MEDKILNNITHASMMPNWVLPKCFWLKKNKQTNPKQQPYTHKKIKINKQTNKKQQKTKQNLKKTRYPDSSAERLYSVRTTANRIFMYVPVGEIPPRIE